jgi:RNA recognition motif-containing protein
MRRPLPRETGKDGRRGDPGVGAAAPLSGLDTGMMTRMNIYVGNLPYSVRDNDLLAMFQEFGNVSSAKVIMDRETDRSKGFGFVEMASADEGANAIEKMNGYEINGRALRVNEARPREDRPRTGGPGGGGGGAGGERRPRRW